MSREAIPFSHHRPRNPKLLAAGQRARELAREGRDIIDLGQSSPHHVTPVHIVEAGIKALRDSHTNIESARGLPEFREAMAKMLARDNGLEVDSRGDAFPTPGSK